MPLAPKVETQSLSLRVNFAWTSIGTIVYAAMQWTQLIVMTKFATTEMVGLFTLALSVTAPIIMLTNAQLRNVQAADVKDKYRFNEYLAVRLVTTFAAVFIILFIAIISAYSTETILIIMAMAVAKSFEAISDIIFGVIQKYEHMDYIGKSQIIKGVTSFIILSITLLITDSIFLSVVSLATVWFLVLVLYDIPTSIMVIRNNYPHKFDKNKLTFSTIYQPYFNLRIIFNILRVVAPLSIVALLNSLVPNLPRYAIESEVGVSALGIFGSLAYMTFAIEIVVIAMGTTTTPRFAQYFLNNNFRGFLRLLAILVSILVIFGAGIIIGSILFGYEILLLIYQREYAEYVDVFIWLMIGAGTIAIGSFLGYVLTAIQAYNSQMIMVLFVTTVTLVASMILVPQYGLLGGAWVMLLSAVIRLLTFGFILVLSLYKASSRHKLASHEV